MPSPVPSSSHAPARMTHVRGFVFAGVILAAFLCYLQRSTLSVVAVALMNERGFTTWQIAWLFNAFLFPYMAFQIPGGLFGQRVGARVGTLACIAVSIAGTALFAGAPWLAAGTLLFGLLSTARFLVGVAQGPLFPTNSGLVQAWFPPQRWGLMNGLQVMGLSFGAAATPPVISHLMAAYGWEAAVASTCIPALVLAVLWWWKIRDTPREHSGVSAAELAWIEAGERPAVARSFRWPQVRAVLANRNILLLTLAYLLQNYVFYFFMNWSFTYLVKSRGLTILEGGVLGMIPLATGALCAALGGYLCDAASSRFGPRWGYRIIPVVTLPLAALLLLIAMQSTSVWVAVVALAACFGCAQMTEAPSWAAAYHLARNQASAATGVLNCGGNIGGIIGTFLVGALVTRFGWPAALTTGIGFALASAATWLVIDASQRVDADGTVT